MHTKGPWKLDGGKGKKGEFYVWNDLREPKGLIGTNETCVAVVAGRFPPDVIAANARLIAAAPDMLSALKHIVEARDRHASEGWLPDGYSAIDDFAADVASIAIEKAGA